MTHQRSVFLIINLYRPSSTFVTSFFHIFVFLRDFLFGRRLLDSNQRHGLPLACSTDWAKSTKSLPHNKNCCTDSISYWLYVVAYSIWLCTHYSILILYGGRCQIRTALQDPKTRVLPLHHILHMAAQSWFEQLNARVKVWCLTAWLLGHIQFQQPLLISSDTVFLDAPQPQSASSLIHCS